MADSRSSTDSETIHSAGSLDPHEINSIAVTVSDVVAALEANRSADRGAVLRITPPFAGRMRARLHVAGGEGTYDGDAEPIHLDPEQLVDDVPEYPTADGTADPRSPRRATDVDTLLASRRGASPSASGFARRSPSRTPASRSPCNCYRWGSRAVGTRSRWLWLSLVG